MARWPLALRRAGIRVTRCLRRCHMAFLRGFQVLRSQKCRRTYLIVCWAPLQGRNLPAWRRSLPADSRALCSQVWCHGEWSYGHVGTLEPSQSTSWCSEPCSQVMAWTSFVPITVKGHHPPYAPWRCSACPHIGNTLWSEQHWDSSCIELAKQSRD